jgi:hypothetical protein
LVTSQVLAVQHGGDRFVIVGTTAGTVYAFDARGRPRWRVRFGRLRHTCNQLATWGIVGTGAVDPGTSAFYVVDSFGRLHALDLSSGAERPGWPVRLYADYRRELVWGAAAIVHGAVYVGTGSYCDRSMEGKVIRVDLATRSVTQWVAVTPDDGGGGGIWGWGGVAYDRIRDSLLVATGNAFEGGTNVGRNFHETAGFGEQVVELSPELEVRGHSHPTNLARRGDYDFVGSPLPFWRQGCGPLVAAYNKNGNVYGWRAGRLDDGNVFSRRAAYNRLVSQLAYSPRTHALYVITNYRLVRVDITTRCHTHIAWRRKLGAGLYNTSPTISGDVLWFVRTGEAAALLGVDARSGKIRFRGHVGAPVFPAPTVIGQRIYVATVTGDLAAFTLR